MPQEPFLKPRLTGKRFEGCAIPLEILKDLAVFDEMIVEIAKYKYLEAHPDRKRSPRGFTEGIELKLTGIEDGSAVLTFSLIAASTVPTLFKIQDDREEYYEFARDAVVNTIGAAENNQSLTDYLPEKMLGYFDRMGRSLRDGEAIEFTIPNKAKPARLTKETRRKLVLASSRAKEVTEDTSIRGTIPEADQDKMTFEVQLPDGKRICAPITEQHFDTIIEAFNGYKKNGINVLLQGIGRFNQQEQLLGFDSIEHVSILDSNDVPARLDKLRLLKNNWLDGRGIAPPNEGIDWLSEEFESRYPDELQLPFLYPTPEGGIQAEWTLASNEISLEIDIVKHTGQWHSLDMETDRDESKKLNLENIEDWKWLVTQIKEMTSKEASHE